MKRFSTFLTEATARKDSHLTHIEDAVLEGGAKGTHDAIRFLFALGKMDKDLILRTKFDGAPALYAGINPENDRFFVGTKSIFNKSPSLNYTVEDIRRNHSGGLAKKLEVALKYLPELDIKGIIHGDFMFLHNDLKKEKIGDKEYITFRPNTITYAVPVDSALAKQMLKSKMGIIWHTTYHGETMDSLKTHFDVNIGNLKSSKNVWFKDNKILDDCTLSSQESDKLHHVLAKADALFDKIPHSLLNEISNNDRYRSLIMAFHNEKVRDGKHIDTKHTKNLIDYVENKYSESTQYKAVEKDIVVRWFKQHAKHLRMTFELQNLLIDAKMLIVRKFDQLNDMNTFLRSDDGKYHTTNHEGYVCAWNKGADAFKLVDRLNYSKVNFLSKKDWSKE